MSYLSNKFRDFHNAVVALLERYEHLDNAAIKACSQDVRALLSKHFASVSLPNTPKLQPSQELFPWQIPHLHHKPRTYNVSQAIAQQLELNGARLSPTPLRGSVPTNKGRGNDNSGPKEPWLQNPHAAENLQWHVPSKYLMPKKKK